MVDVLARSLKSLRWRHSCHTASHDIICFAHGRSAVSAPKGARAAASMTGGHCLKPLPRRAIPNTIRNHPAALKRDTPPEPDQLTSGRSKEGSRNRSDRRDLVDKDLKEPWVVGSTSVWRFATLGLLLPAWGDYE